MKFEQFEEWMLWYILLRFHLIFLNVQYHSALETKVLYGRIYILILVNWLKNVNRFKEENYEERFSCCCCCCCCCLFVCFCFCFAFVCFVLFCFVSFSFFIFSYLFISLFILLLTNHVKISEAHIYWTVVDKVIVHQNPFNIPRLNIIASRKVREDHLRILPNAPSLGPLWLGYRLRKLKICAVNNWGEVPVCWPNQ